MAIAATGDVQFCNFAPYDTEAVFFEKKDEAFEFVSAHSLSAGSCGNVRLVQSDHLFYYIRAANSMALTRLFADTAVRDEWGGWPLWTSPTYENAVCVDTRSGVIRTGLLGGDCGGDTMKLGLQSVGFDENGQFWLESTDPYICSRDIGVDCWGKLDATLEWASSLKRSLEASARSVETEQADIRFGLIPNAVGFETLDHNGPYKIGVIVTVAHTVTPLGSSIAVREGDVIVEFNGQPVFDRNDMVYYIVRHAEVAGFDEPHTIVFEREGLRYTAEGFQIFHRDTYGAIFLNPDGSCAVTSGAALTGALREASFYTNAVLGCVVLGDDLQLLRSKPCEFRVNQLVAAYRQFCPDVTFYSTIVGGVFMLGREIPESMLSSFVFRGMRAPARVLRAIVLEGAEEAARAVLTLPPGIRAKDNLGLIREQAATGAAIGVGFTIAFPRGLL